MRLVLAILLYVAGAARADIVLLLSDDRPSVVSVARAVQAHYPQDVEIHNLGGEPGRENEVAEAVARAPARQVVAIGLLAAQVARKRLSSKQVVFCQILNIDEFDLVTPWMKGVSAIPSLDRQFAAWRSLNPALNRIGVITGRNAGYMVGEARSAAGRIGLELVHLEVSSDRAVLPAARSLRDSNVNALWLAPDSSILSQRAILETMSYAVKNNIQVLAFSPALLREGALLSATADADEIARAVIERLRRARDTPGVPGEPVTGLQLAKIVVSKGAAARFGLPLPARLRESADVR